MKSPGNGRLNNLNDPVLNVLKYIPSMQHVSATRSHHQVSYTRTDPHLVFGVRLGSQLFTLLGYCCIQCSNLVKIEVI